MSDLKYIEILKSNNMLKTAMKGDEYKAAVLSNITVSQIKDIFEYTLRSSGINCDVEFGDYDNIVQGSEKYKHSNLVVVFWELANILSGLQYKANSFSDGEVELLESKVKSEIDAVISNLKDTTLVLINRFSSLAFNYCNLRMNRFDSLCLALNKYLDSKLPSNAITVDIDKIFAKLSIEKSIDLRNFYSSKALYTVGFYKEYADFIKPVILSARGKSKKALILDCDNTLWKGVLGEDGFDGIEMSDKTSYGSIFAEVQSMILELGKKGVLLGLCSKNNPGDVDEVLNKHPDMKLRDGDISVKSVNWDDKSSNLKNIAKNLNIGLDSLVLLEDSSFEIDFIRKNLPQVTVIQVPPRLEEYPRILRENLGLFFNISESPEDFRRIQMYKEEDKRESSRAKYGGLENYLKSLKLDLTIFSGIVPGRVSRISQLTQKTNQFNLTTKRYTEADINRFVKQPGYEVFCFNAADKFGDYGITGLSIIKLDVKNQKADIDTLLMSCRVIGRNLEYAFFDFLVKYLKKRKLKTISAAYIATSKNSQVAGFFKSLGFTLVSNKNNTSTYEIQIKDYAYKNLDYIGVKHGK
jgi:FkbH-like protein